MYKFTSDTSVASQSDTGDMHYRTDHRKARLAPSVGERPHARQAVAALPPGSELLGGALSVRVAARPLRRWTASQHDRARDRGEDGSEVVASITTEQRRHVPREFVVGRAPSTHFPA